MISRNGLTLIELIFVLSIISVISLLTPVVKRNICEDQIDYFLNSLDSDINFSMNHSITNFKVIKIRFYPSENRYMINDAYSKNIKQNSFDKNLVMTSHITNNTIEISRGHVLTTQYFFITCKTLKYRINVLEKSGVIEKIKQ